MEKIAWQTIERKLTVWLWLVAAMATAIALGTWAVFRESLPPELPIFYSLPWGEEQLARPELLGVPLGIILAIAFVFPIISKSLIKDGVLKVLVTGSGLVAVVIMMAAILRAITRVI